MGPSKILGVDRVEKNTSPLQVSNPVLKLCSRSAVQTVGLSGARISFMYMDWSVDTSSIAHYYYAMTWKKRWCIERKMKIWKSRRYSLLVIFQYPHGPTGLTQYSTSLWILQPKDLTILNSLRKKRNCIFLPDLSQQQLNCSKILKNLLEI